MDNNTVIMLPRISSCLAWEPLPAAVLTEPSWPRTDAFSRKVTSPKVIHPGAGEGWCPGHPCGRSMGAVGGGWGDRAEPQQHPVVSTCQENAEEQGQMGGGGHTGPAGVPPLPRLPVSFLDFP